MSTAGGQGPDLSRMVSLIMQNPDLIKQIEALARQDTEQTSPAGTEGAPPTTAAPEDATDTTEIPVAAMQRSTRKREKRTQLLTALRPYVSEKRSKTLDTLIGMTDLFDLIGRG